MATSYAEGYPDSITCRWCGVVKQILNGSRFCATCDGPGHAPATWEEKK